MSTSTPNAPAALAPRRLDTGTPRKGNFTEQSARGQWWRFLAMGVITSVVLVPIAAVVWLSFRPGLGSSESAPTLENFEIVVGRTQVLTWLGNSLLTALVTVVIAVVVAAPAGYVLSRGRNKLVSGYSLLLFVVQSVPIVISVIPLFILFAQLQMVDTLAGITVIYVGSTMSVAIWMMTAYYDTIPVALEEAAWIDGASVFGGFARIVLRNSLPGVLSTAIFCFLLAWNDYLVALVFLRSNANFTLPVGLQTFFQQNTTNWGPVMAMAVIMMLPPVIVFAFLNKYFSVGGIGGSLAGR